VATEQRAPAHLRSGEPDRLAVGSVNRRGNLAAANDNSDHDGEGGA
jgi:hypothetical protein